MAKLVNIKSKRSNVDGLSAEQCRNLLNADGYDYTDEELIQIQAFLFKLAKIYYDFYITTLRHRAKVISINDRPYGTEESNHLCTRKHRRAS